MFKIVLLPVFLYSFSSLAEDFIYKCESKDSNDNFVQIEFNNYSNLKIIQKDELETVLYNDHLACGLKKTGKSNCSNKIEFKSNGDIFISYLCFFKNSLIKEMSGQLEWHDKDQLGAFVCGPLPSRNLEILNCEKKINLENR